MGYVPNSSYFYSTMTEGILIYSLSLGLLVKAESLFKIFLVAFSFEYDHLPNFILSTQLPPISRAKLYYVTTNFSRYLLRFYKECLEYCNTANCKCNDLCWLCLLLQSKFLDWVMQDDELEVSLLFLKVCIEKRWDFSINHDYCHIIVSLTYFILLAHSLLSLCKVQIPL